MKENDIKQTINYDKFVITDWNRAIKPKNLKKIDASVKEKGWLKHPILVNENMEVIDGQHRLIYAKEHGLPVYYAVINGLGADDCVTMNNARNGWTLADYINFYAKQGVDDFIILQNMVSKYSFLPPSVIVSIVKDVTMGGNTLKMIKNGSFTLTTKEYNRAIEILDFLNECAPYILRVPGRPSALFFAITFAYNCPGIDKQKLRNQIKTNISIVTPPANTDMAFEEVEKLYNYRCPRDKYVFIHTEYKRRANDRMAHKGRGI